MTLVIILSFILISIPEEALIALSTALIVGRKELVRFNSNSVIVRFIIVTVLTAISTVILKYIPDELRVLVQLLIFILAYIYILKLRWYEATIGLLVYLTGYLAVEYAYSICTTSIEGITVMQAHNNALLLFIFFLPVRLFQGLFVYFLKKSDIIIINFEIINRSRSIIKRILLISVCLSLSLLHVFLNTKFFMIDHPLQTTFNDMFMMWYNLSYSVVLSLTLIIITVKLSRTVNEKKRVSTVSLKWFKHLLDEHGHDIMKVKRIVDDAIKNEKGR